DQLEARRIRYGPARAHDADDSVFERLAQRLQRFTPKLRELVQEENAAMRKRHFARMRHAASAADQPGRRSRVMRRAERSMRREGATVGQQTDDRRNTR